jgi:hypothetical protein
MPMPMGGEQMPPMGSDEEVNGDMTMPMDGNQMPPQDEKLPSEFDSNFDAGVEADEETDPKKFIQQLTGKLSQSLNSYNNENGEPDTELGKYVLGMLVKQGTKGMDEKDKKEIIKKINTDNSEEELPDDSEEMPEEPMNDEMDNEEMQMESKKIIRCTKKQIFESFGVAVDDENPSKNAQEPDTKITPDTIKNRRTRPFEAPKKFRD